MRQIPHFKETTKMQTFVLKGRAGQWSYGYLAEPGKRNVWVYTNSEVT